MDQSPKEMQARIAQLEMLVSSARHDVRSALAPAMLAADRMKMHDDPKVRRSGEFVIRAIERVLEMLQETREIVPPRAAGKQRPNT